MELGSEYNLSLSELTIKENNLFKYLSEYNCLYTDTGRSALKIISSSLKEVLLPEYICESVINCFEKNTIKFYHIEKDGKIDKEDLIGKINKNTQAVFIMHYFGVLQPKENLKKIKEVATQNNIVIIEDTTHSVFSSRQTIGDFMIASIRKWMPISMGGVIYSRHTLPNVDKIHKSKDNERNYGMVLKELFLKGVVDCNSLYRNIFKECEEKIDSNNEIMLLSDFSRFIISCTDIIDLKQKRIENYNFLLRELDKIGIEPINKIMENDCPFVFPMRIPNRDRFRAYLINHNIYCAVHWPINDLCLSERQRAVNNANAFISLPIDQRYGKKELQYLINIIRNYEGALLF